MAFAVSTLKVQLTDLAHVVSSAQPSMQTLVKRGRAMTSAAFVVSLKMLVATALSIRCAILKDKHNTKSCG